MKRKATMLLVFILIISLLSSCVDFDFGDSNSGSNSDNASIQSGSIATSLIYINEYMKSGTVLLDEDGDYSPFVEIYNSNDSAVDLKGYGLSDNSSKPLKWTFPDITVEAGEYLVVYLSGKSDKLYSAGGELHASFKLSKSDNFLSLADSDGNVIDSQSLVELSESCSFGRDTEDIDSWLYFPRPTPGDENSTQGFEDFVESSIFGSSVYISEVASANSMSYKNSSGEYLDWIELYNPTDNDINLAGFGLSDDDDIPYKYTFSDVTLNAGGYLTVFCADIEKQTSEGELYLPFSLSATGETLVLTNAEGCTVDKMRTGLLREGYSSGRKSGEYGTRMFFETPTPSTSNSSVAYSGYTKTPTISHDGGYVSSGTVIEFLASEGAVIYYTTDGSMPTALSNKYTSPISIHATGTLRAIAIEEGKLPSSDVCRTFLTEDEHDIPVVALSGDPDGIFGPNGLYENYSKTADIEVPVHFQYYTEQGNLGIDFNAGLKIFGAYSRSEAQKSFSVNLRGKYGQTEVTYPFFRDYDQNTFSSLVLRTSGQDWFRSKLRDAFMTQMIKGYVDIEYQEYRPVALYINGEYWGLYNLRERINEDYVASHANCDADDVDLIKGDSYVQAGSKDEYTALVEYVKTHDLSNNEYYQYVCSVMDVENYMNWWICETFYANTDTGNIRCYKAGDGKWRWVLYDLDWGLTASTYNSSINRIKDKMLGQVHGASGSGGFSTALSRGLMANEEFKNKFIETYAYYLNNVWTEQRVDTILNAMADEIRSEIPRQHVKWEKPSVETFESQIEFLREAVAYRVQRTKSDLKETFNLSDSQMKELGLD